MSAKCRNCGNVMKCQGVWWVRLECTHCGYTYEPRFKKCRTHDELLDQYANERWNNERHKQNE